MKWLWFAVLCLFEFLADVSAKGHVVRGSAGLAVLAVLGYVLGNTAWVMSLRAGMPLSIGAVLFGIMTGSVATLVGVGMFKETLNVQQVCGLIFGLISTVLLTKE